MHKRKSGSTLGKEAQGGEGEGSTEFLEEAAAEIQMLGQSSSRQWR